MLRSKRLNARLSAGLTGLAAISVLLAGGLHAAARQTLSRIQAQRSQLPGPPVSKQQDAPAIKPGVSPAPTAAQTADKDRLVDIEMDHPSINQKTGMITGRNLKYRDPEEKMTVTGDTAQHDQNKDTVDTKGSLIMDDPNHHVTGDKAHVERKTKLAIVTGNVVIVLKPKEEQPAAPVGGVENNKADVKKDRNRGGTITCDQVDDYYKKEFAILTGHLVFKQIITKDNGEKVERTLTADHAEYDGKANKMHLFLPVKGHDSDGQEMEFEKDVMVGTKEGEETVESEGRASFKYLLKPDNDSADEKQPGKKSDKAVKPPQ